jgi:hypothetical protein
MQPATLYVTVHVPPPTVYNSPSSLPTEVEVSPAEEATLPGRIQSPHPLPLSHHQPVETEITIPKSREEVSLTSTRDPRSGIHQADEAMKQIDRSDMCEGAIRRIKWVMDTLSPVAEVRVIPF